MNAKDIVNKLVEGGLDDPSQNFDRHADEIYKERRFGGKLLASEPAADPIAETHFDCWSDSADPEDIEGYWEEFDPKCVNQMKLLVAEWSKLPNVDATKLAEIAGYYMHSGRSHTFEMLADVFINAGYSVWHSDDRFEVYNPADIAEEENVEDATNE